MPDDIYLRVYLDRSELVKPDGSVSTFYEGSMAEAAQKRYRDLETTLEDGFFEKVIVSCRDQGINSEIAGLSDDQVHLLDALVKKLPVKLGVH